MRGSPTTTGWRAVVAMLAVTVAVPAGAQTQTGAATSPVAPALGFVFEEIVTLAPDIRIGPTPFGGRNIVPITGGTFSGPLIRGEVIPGGWDWQLARTDNCLDIAADYMLRTDDGVVIHLVNKGVACRPAPGERRPVTTTPVFEAPLGKYAWLNERTFVDTLEPTSSADGKPAVRIRIFEVRP